jgi:hypothetical protein
MFSLYEQNPKNWDNLADQGKPNLREVAKHFDRACDMDRALGINSAAAHWHAGRNSASLGSDAMARAWLEKNAKQQEEPQAVSATKMLLVVAPASVAGKLEKVAAMMGCEVTEID